MFEKFSDVIVEAEISINWDSPRGMWLETANLLVNPRFLVAGVCAALVYSIWSF